MDTDRSTSRWRVLSRQLLFAVSTLLTTGVWAGDRALLIGVNTYADPVHNLPGIDLDLKQMEQFVRKIGFASADIRTLVGPEVTLENVREQFTGFLSHGVAADDSIFIYYSGHGMQVPDRNGDEEDRRDEAISLYNLNPAVSGWDGVLLDDEFAELLRALPSENVVVVVDACHSGTVTRGYQSRLPSTTKAFADDEFVVKALEYRGKSGSPTGYVRNPGSITDEIPAGVVALSASQDDQLSLASKQGSLFTLALSQTLEKQRSDATAQSLIQGATAILEAQLDEDLMFLPNLSGDELLFGKRLARDPSADSRRVNWDDMVKLVSDLAPMDVVSNQTAFMKDDAIGLQITAPEDGYINIVAIDSNDEMILLFPNAQDEKNQISAGVHEYPGNRNFEWAAQAPWGSTMIVSLFSKSPVNLFDSSTQRYVNGETTLDYVLPPLAGLLEFGLQRSTKAGDMLMVKTCESEETC